MAPSETKGPPVLPPVTDGVPTVAPRAHDTLDAHGRVYHLRFVNTGPGGLRPSALFRDVAGCDSADGDGGGDGDEPWTRVGARVDLPVNGLGVATFDSGEGATIRIFPKD